MDLPDVEMIVNVIVLVHNTIIFSYHAYYILPSVNKNQYVQWLSLLSMFLMIIFLFGSITSYINVYIASSTYCRWKRTYNAILYASCKLSIYFLFVERLFAVFKDSQLQFKQVQKCQSRFIFITWWILFIILFIFFPDNYKFETNGQWNHCIVYPKPSSIITSVLVILGDLCFSVLISILFSRRLLMLLYQSTESIDQSIYKVTLLKVLRKTTLLTFITVFSTQMSMLFCSFMKPFDAIWVSLDFMINAWGILLIFASHKKIYMYICENCETCVTIKCLSCWSCQCCCFIANLSLSDKMDKPTLSSVATTSNPSLNSTTTK